LLFTNAGEGMSELSLADRATIANMENSCVWILIISHATTYKNKMLGYIEDYFFHILFIVGFWWLF